jgi:hypothetical protein
MGVRQSLVRAFLKLNIFARTPKESTLGDKVEKKIVYLSENKEMEEMVSKIRESKEYQVWLENKDK